MFTVTEFSLRQSVLKMAVGLVVDKCWLVLLLAVCRHGMALVQSSGHTGTFLSINYPSEYNPNTDELYAHHFLTSGPQQVYVVFTYSLEKRDYNGKCRDYLEVFNDTERLCGIHSGTLYMHIPSDQFYLRFHSDSDVQAQGFNYTFSVISGTCHPTLNNAGIYNYQLMPIVDMLSRDSLVVSVRGCNVVDFAFSSSDTNVYKSCREVILGGWQNSRSQVKTCTTGVYGTCILEREIHHSPLNCCEFRHLWFHWTNSTLAGGMGDTVGDSAFFNMSFTQSFPVKFIYLAGFGGNAFVITFDANFPDSYCDTPANLTLPGHCPVNTTIADVTTTTSPDVTTLSNDVTTTATQNVITGTDDVISTTESMSVTTNSVGATVEPTQPPIQEPPTNSKPSYPRKYCHCNCLWVRPPPVLTPEAQEKQEEEMEEVKEKAVEAIKKNLTMSPRNVSATVRRYVSAEDGRTSSKTLGIVGGVLCAIPFTAILLVDVWTALLALKRIVQNRCQQTQD